MAFAITKPAPPPGAPNREAVMTATLVPLSGSETIEVTLDRLNEMADWLINVATPKEMGQALSDLNHVSEWLRMHHAAAELRIQATRLECLALRRLGQSFLPDQEKRIPSGVRSLASKYAAVTDEQFTELMESVSDRHTMRTVQRILAEKRMVWLGRSIGKGKVIPDMPNWNGNPNGSRLIEWELPTDEEYINSFAPDSRIAVAAHILLEQLLIETDERAKSFTTASLTDRLCGMLMELGNNDPYFNETLMDPTIREGITEVVRYALRSHYSPDGHPEYVSYRLGVIWDGEVRNDDPDEPGGTWVRVPWGAATLDQLRAMAAHRAAQAAALVAKAAELDELASLLSNDGKTPGTALVAPLLAHGMTVEASCAS